MFASGVWLECFKIVFLCHFALSFAFVFGFWIFSVFRFFDFFGFGVGFIVFFGCLDFEIFRCESGIFW
jgi:hypothetical protein